jgi:hypothetical protein
LEIVDWIDELLNWITKYEMTIVTLIFVGTAALCGDAPMRQGIQEVKGKSKHTMSNTYRPPSVYIEET